VRRTTPEIPRTRPRRTVTPSRTHDALAVSQLEQEQDDPPPPGPEYSAPARSVRHDAHPGASAHAPAGVASRLAAAVIDIVLLGGIDTAVVYLTLALAGLTWEQYAMLPLAPLVGFLVILNGGYLVAFVAASGQTIGKMLTRVRVVGDDGRRVDVAGAALRAAGCGVSLLTAGAAYLPFFFTSERRTLQDRIAGTRVVSAR
jgi:uncharacterized RDD family membrane protein YckC